MVRDAVFMQGEETPQDSRQSRTKVLLLRAGGVFVTPQLVGVLLSLDSRPGSRGGPRKLAWRAASPTTVATRVRRLRPGELARGGDERVEFAKDVVRAVDDGGVGPGRVLPCPFVSIWSVSSGQGRSPRRRNATRAARSSSWSMSPSAGRASGPSSGRCAAESRKARQDTADCHRNPTRMEAPGVGGRTVTSDRAAQRPPTRPSATLRQAELDPARRVRQPTLQPLKINSHRDSGSPVTPKSSM